MTTYQLFKDDKLQGDKLTIEQCREYLTAGANQISGTNEGQNEIKSVYKLREGGKITMIQNP